MSGRDVQRKFVLAGAQPPDGRLEPRTGDAAPQAAGSALVGSLPYGAAVQRRSAPGGGGGEPDSVQAAAAAGVTGAGGPLPHSDRIQPSFGHHDVSGVAAHGGGAATHAARSIDALAYTVGGAVAFAGAPSLHTAAHEAAHVVQQRAGVHLKGGVGEVGDVHEQHADAVAAAVVSGKSAEGLLDRYSAGGAPAGAPARAVQRFYLKHDADDGYDWVDDEQWDPSRYEAADPQPFGWLFRSLYRRKASVPPTAKDTGQKAPEDRAPAEVTEKPKRTTAKGPEATKPKTEAPPPSDEPSAQDRFNQLDRLVSQMDKALRQKPGWLRSGELTTVRTYVQTIRKNKADAKKSHTPYAYKEKVLDRQLTIAEELKADLDAFEQPPAPEPTKSAPQKAPKTSGSPDPSASGGGEWSKVKSATEKRQEAQERFDISSLRATVDGHTGDPAAISVTFNQLLNGCLAQGEDTEGAIVEKYETVAERGTGRFSIEVSIPGLANWVIHVHCDDQGKTASGNNAIHYKRVADRGTLGVSITLTPRQENAMMPDPPERLAYPLRRRR